VLTVCAAAKDAVFVDGVPCVQCNIHAWLGVALLEVRQQLECMTCSRAQAAL